MKLTPVITALRSHCPWFSGRVAGAISLSALQAQAVPTLPAAWVIAGDDIVAPQRSATDYWQRLTEVFTVVVVLADNPDEQAQDAFYDQPHRVRAMLWKALLGWSPDADSGPIQYDRGPLCQRANGQLWYQFTFSLQRDITESDSRQQDDLAALVDFTDIDIGLDYIDPGGGPDGDPEHRLTLNPNE